MTNLGTLQFKESVSLVFVGAANKKTEELEIAWLRVNQSSVPPKSTLKHKMKWVK